MIVVIFLFLAIFIASCLHLYWYQGSERKYADIPTVQPRLPVVGNAWSLRMSRCHLALMEWAKQYGSVFRFRLYSQEILVLNDYESIYDALVVKGSDFAGRPSTYRANQGGRNKHSIVWQTYTKDLQFLRKEVHRSLKIGIGDVECLEQKCLPEISAMLDKMAEHGTGTFDPWSDVYEAVCNIMLGLTLNQRFNSSSPNLQQLKDINRLFNEIYGSGNARGMDFLPWLPWIGHRVHYRKLQRALRMRDDFWTRELSDLKARGFPQCIIQRFLHSLTKSNEEHASEIQEKTAKEVFTNLILAGTDTTATSLTSLLLVFLHRPEVQETMWQEIRRHVGLQRPVALEDRPQLPYCQAVLLELLRFISHVPLAVPHSTVRDSSVLGMFVPRGMTVYVNLWALHHSHRHWHDPWTFDPSRFLDNSGQVVPPSHPARKMLMAFGAGRRVCLGEILAKNRLFLFATSLVQRFCFQPGDAGQENGQLPPLDPRCFEMGLVIHPAPFKLSVKQRY